MGASQLDSTLLGVGPYTEYLTIESLDINPWRTAMRLDYKPLSANIMYTMRKKKSHHYLKYEKAWNAVLSNYTKPADIDVDLWKALKFRLTLNVAFSNKASDLDNSIKPIQDIFQKHFEFNDKQIYEIEAFKLVVPKTMEYVEAELITLRSF